MCISTDGFTNEVRISSINELQSDMTKLFSSYDRIKHLGMMERMSRFCLNEEQFAHLIGKIRMYQHLDREGQKSKQPFLLNDGQINSVVKDYQEIRTRIFHFGIYTIYLPRLIRAVILIVI